MRIQRPNGELRWVRDVGRVCRDSDGTIVYATGAMTDITELKLANEAVAESAFFYRQTLESLPGMTFTATSDGVVDYMSRQWLEFTGVAELALEDTWGVIHPDDRERAIAAWQSAVASSRKYDLEYRVRRRDGAYEWFKVRAGAIRDGSGKVVRWIGTAMNVNDLKHTEAALRESEEALRNADRRKDEFLATLAHELRNPLAPIRSGLDVLEHARGEAMRRRAEKTIERQLGHMVRLVDDLLDVSRISRGQIELQRAQLPLENVMDAAVETSRPSIEAGGHRLNVVMSDEPLWVDGDLTRLAQVVSNLLNNAAKYTPPGGRIDVHLFADRSELVIRVTDTGIGIDADTLPRVFELFARGTDARALAQSGLGIGLSLVRDVLRMHGGTITAESAGLGQGSTFEVRLPRASKPRQGGEEYCTPLASGTILAAARRKILVVDDNIDAAEMLALMLELRGHETCVAHDGSAALEQARKARPDVVFLDSGLPGMDAGAINTCALLSSPLAKGLFSSALMESGNCAADPLSQQYAKGTVVVTSANCAFAPDVAACLQNAPVSSIVQNAGVTYLGSFLTGVVTTNFDASNIETLPFGPSIDGYVLEAAPIDTIKAGKHNHVPLVIGTNSRELAWAIPSALIPSIPFASCVEYAALVTAMFPSLALRILQTYRCNPLEGKSGYRELIAATSDAFFTCPSRRALRAAAATQTEPVYRYLFTHGRADHTAEIPYVFGLGGTPKPEESLLSQQMQSYWVNLATSGNPNADGLPTWNVYDPKLDTALKLETPIVEDAPVEAAGCNFWDTVQ